MRDLGVLTKFVITRHCWRFQSCSLCRKVVQCSHFKTILIKILTNIPGFFLTPKVGLLFGPVSVGHPFAKSQKRRDLSVLAEFDVTQHCGHFRSCGFRQMVVRCWQFNHNLRKISSDFRGVFLKPLESATFSVTFPWSPLRKISENARFGCSCGVCHNSTLRALLEPLFAPKRCTIIAL